MAADFSEAEMRALIAAQVASRPGGRSVPRTEITGRRACQNRRDRSQDCESDPRRLSEIGAGSLGTESPSLT